MQELTTDEIKEFLSLVFSADGGVVLGIKWHKRFMRWEIARRVILSCKHPELLMAYKGLVNKIGIDSKLISGKVVIDTKENIKKFQINIGFIDGVKAAGKSKYWKGFDKNVVLDISIQSYYYNNTFLRVKTKEEIIDSLHYMSADRVGVFTH